MLDKTDAKDRTLTLTRHIPAPVSQVWAAWTDPERLPQWWGPRGFTCETKEIRLGPNGVWRFDMIAPDGTRYANRHRYTRVEPEARIDYRLDDDGTGAHAFDASVRFEPEGDGCRLTLIMVTDDPAHRDMMVEFGAIEHGYTTLDCLTEAVLGDGTLSITRLYDAPRKAVWSAWTDPKALARWFVPDDCTMPEGTFDMRAGGRYDCLYVGKDSGNRYSMGGTVLSVTPQSRLVFTHGWKDADGHVKDDTEITVSLDEIGTRTRVTMLQSGLPDAAAAATHAEGWGYVLDSLRRELA